MGRPVEEIILILLQQILVPVINNSHLPLKVILVRSISQFQLQITVPVINHCPVLMLAILRQILLRTRLTAVEFYVYRFKVKGCNARREAFSFDCVVGIWAGHWVL